MARVVIFIGGGLVESVISDEPIQVIVCDTDADAAHPDDLTTMDNGEEVYLNEYEPTEDAEAVDAVFKMLSEEETAADAD